VIILKKNISYLYKKLEYINIVEHSKELVLLYAGVVEFNISLNSEKWQYMKAYLEETSHSN
jgi:hypothetical protein